MREGIHPNYHHDAVVKCACGNTFTTGSVKEELKVDICANATHSSLVSKKSLISAVELISSTRNSVLTSNLTFFDQQERFLSFLFSFYFKIFTLINMYTKRESLNF